MGDMLVRMPCALGLSPTTDRSLTLVPPTHPPPPPTPHLPPSAQISGAVAWPYILLTLHAIVAVVFAVGIRPGWSSFSLFVFHVCVKRKFSLDVMGCCGGWRYRRLRLLASNIRSRHRVNSTSEFTYAMTVMSTLTDNLLICTNDIATSPNSTNGISWRSNPTI